MILFNDIWFAFSRKWLATMPFCPSRKASDTDHWTLCELKLNNNKLHNRMNPQPRSRVYGVKEKANLQAKYIVWTSATHLIQWREIYKLHRRAGSLTAPWAMWSFLKHILEPLNWSLLKMYQEIWKYLRAFSNRGRGLVVTNRAVKMFRSLLLRLLRTVNIFQAISLYDHMVPIDWYP